MKMNVMGDFLGKKIIFKNWFKKKGKTWIEQQQLENKERGNWRVPLERAPGWVGFKVSYTKP